MNRVIEQTVTWRHKDTKKVSTVRYFVAGSDRYSDLAETHTTALLDEDVAAIEEYRRACEEGKAELVSRPGKRKVE